MNYAHKDQRCGNEKNNEQINKEKKTETDSNTSENKVVVLGGERVEQWVKQMEYIKSQL